MRDILTILAGLLIVALTAALAIPPLIDWPAQREFVDRAITRAVGAEARSDGALDIRLLPSPRIKMDRLRLGSTASAEASLDAMFVRAEIALAPLLSGEVRFLETRIGRAEFKLPTGTGGALRVPRRFVADAAGGRSFVFEALDVRQLLVTTVDPRTGRTDQAYAEGVRVQANSLRGPWRLDGTARTGPFELALGEIGPDLSTTLKLGGGGGERPRFDIDGRVELVEGPDDSLLPRFAGSLKLAVPPAARPSGTTPLPVTAQAAVKAAGREVAFEGITIEAGEGAASVRLTGSGRYRIDEPRLSLALEGRRIDVPALLAGSPDGLGPRLAPWRALATGRPIDLTLKLDGLAVGGDEDLTAFRATGTLRDELLTVEALEIAAPGGTAVRLSGDIGLGSGATGAGRVELRARESDRLARYLDAFGMGALQSLVDGRPLEAVADVTLANPVVSLRNMRVSQGDAVLTGTLRYSAPEAGLRGRVDAQLAATGLDLSRSLETGPLFEAARTLDYGIALDARALSYGASRNGRIAARLGTEGGSVVVDVLEVADLAGAEARLSGRLSPDGSGRIEGRLQAARAAPLVDLFGRAWLGGAVRLVPAALRDGPLDVAVRAERVLEAGRPAPALRTSVRGTAAGGPIEASTVSVEGEVRSLDATLSTDRTDSWFGLSAPALRRPSRLELAAARDGSGLLAAQVRGELAGVRIATLRPWVLGPGDDRVESGEAEITATDASALLLALGDTSTSRGPLPLALKVAVSRADAVRLALTGRVADADVSADLSIPSATEIAGTARLSRVSLPWLASAFALQTPPSTPGSAWPTTRFGAKATLPVVGSVQVRTAALDLGAGLVGRDASFVLAATPDGVAFREMSAALAGGRITGEASLNRQGGLASLIGEGAFERLELPAFMGPPFTAGRIGGRLRFGASGESLAALVSNLGGAGDLELDGLRIEAADPAAVERVAARALRSDDPLAGPRLAQLLAEELARGPLTVGKVAAPATLTAGFLRLTPLRLGAETGRWQGAATVDLRTLALDARGSLQPNGVPRNWTAAPPYVTLGWTGPLARPARSVDPGPLVSGLASVVLQRELERIEVFELDAAERSRLNARVEMDKQRRLAAEETARQVRLREEAAERARLEAERARLEAERARAAAEAGPPPSPPERRSAPIDIRPPAQTGGSLAPSGAAGG